MWWFISDALKQMLNLNEPDSKSEVTMPVWKVLIYDRVGQDIISPLISIKELRDLGITLYMLVFLNFVFKTCFFHKFLISF